MSQRIAPRRSTGITRLLSGPAPVVALLAIHVLLGLSAVAHKSITYDESAHLGGGFSYWAANDYRLHAENGNWSQRWAALPLWWHGYQLPVADSSWPISDVWGITERMLAAMGPDADVMLWRARMMMAVPSALLGLLVYLWSRHIFGPAGGLVSLTLYAFSPTVLANGFLATSDLMASLFFLAASGAVWALLHRVTPLTLVAAVFSLSGLMLSKSSGVLIVPMALAMVVARMWHAAPLPIDLGSAREVVGRARQALVFAAVAAVQVLGVALVIWASYGFRYSMFAPAWQEGAHTQVPWADVEGGSPRLQPFVHFAREHHLLPEGYLYGFSYTLLYANARVGFLNGEFGYTGWTSFFPLALLWKTPLTLFLMLALAAWALATCRDPVPKTAGDTSDARRARLYALMPLAALFIVYWGVALRSHLNIGHRHILPTYPPMFIFAGATGLWFPLTAGQQAGRKGTSPRGERETAKSPSHERQVHVARGATIAALVLAAVEAIGVWPNYLAYFNVVAGGSRQGYRRLVDSSLDWGQELIGLKKWLDEHPVDSGNPQRVFISYFGTGRPAQYNIRGRALPSFPPRWDITVPEPLTGGTYCISATMLQGVYIIPFAGSWNETYEHNYQQLRQVVLPFQRAMSSPEILKQMLENSPLPELQEAFRMFRVLRFARLCSCLRQREPDDQIGYSILIYRLSDLDVATALEGGPCELTPAPATEPTNTAASSKGSE